MAIPLIFALLLVNGYHTYLILRIRPRMGVNSVSESALFHAQTLTMYRIIHSVCAVIFISYALSTIYLGSTYIFPSVLLIIAGALDITQSFLLTKRTSHSTSDFFDPHQLSAWLMSIFYVSSCIVFLSTIGLWYQLALPIIALLVLTAFWLIITGNKYFYVCQMVFFFAVSVGLGATVLNV